MSKSKNHPPRKAPTIIDSKKSNKHGLIWRKNKSWNIETINQQPHKYKIYGGITFSGKNYKPFEGWFFCGPDDATSCDNFDKIEDAMEYVEENLDRKFFV